MTGSPHFDVSTDEAGVVWITMDVEGKSVNVMTQAVTADFCAIIDVIVAHPPTGLVFRSGKARGFIFGADVNEFADFKTRREVEAHIRPVLRCFQQIEDI